MRKIKGLVIHHSGNKDTVEKIRNLHVNKNGWDDVGYHFMILKNGIIVKGRELNVVGAHSYGNNQNSLGICLVGNFDNTKLEGKQLQSLKILLEELTKKFNLKKEDIILHRDLPNVTKSCPGNNVNKEIIFSETCVELLQN